MLSKFVFFIAANRRARRLSENARGPARIGALGKTELRKNGGISRQFGQVCFKFSPSDAQNIAAMIIRQRE